MPVPRLPEATSSIDVTITVNKKLRPYFEIWFQKKRKAGETPAQFALRVLKANALKDYIEFEVPPMIIAIDEEKRQSATDLVQDANSISGEVD